VLRPAVIVLVIVFVGAIHFVNLIIVVLVVVVIVLNHVMIGVKPIVIFIVIIYVQVVIQGVQPVLVVVQLTVVLIVIMDVAEDVLVVVMFVVLHVILLALLPLAHTNFIYKQKIGMVLIPSLFFYFPKYFIRYFYNLSSICGDNIS